MTLTADEVRRVLNYDPATGIFRWAVDRRRGGVKAGSVAGCDGGKGYIQIKIDHRLYRAHRLAFFYMTGEWPRQFVDHIDGNVSNNAWANLREATPSENQWNSKAQKNSTTGLKGVCRRPKGKFHACLMHRGRNHYLGTYDTAIEARAAYVAASRELHGAFARAS